MAAQEIVVKKYVVRLSGDEREQLATLIRKGKSPAQRLMKARILLKADGAEAGEGLASRVSAKWLCHLHRSKRMSPGSCSSVASDRKTAVISALGLRASIAIMRPRKSVSRRLFLTSCRIRSIILVEPRWPARELVHRAAKETRVEPREILQKKKIAVHATRRLIALLGDT